MTTISQLPTIALLPGDRNGIGPEIVAKFLADNGGSAPEARLLLVGDPKVVELGARQAGVVADYRTIDRLEDIRAAGETGRPLFLAHSSCPEDEAAGAGHVSTAAGAEVLDQLAFLLRGAKAGLVDGIVHAPFNKVAMRQGGLKADVIDFVIDELGHDGVSGELSVLGDLWTSRVTSHVALRDVAGLIDEDRILAAVRLMHATLREAGHARPRLAVAGLNPHAGDGGVLGDEEIRIIGPAVERAAAEGIDVTGPLPADSVFVAAKDGAFDAVVAMYHDQSQLALKLLGFGQGVTLLGGFSIPITTVMHGTAYDIVGQGKAVTTGFANAFELCRKIAAARTHAKAT